MAIAKSHKPLIIQLELNGIVKKCKVVYEATGALTIGIANVRLSLDAEKPMLLARQTR